MTTASISPILNSASPSHSSFWQRHEEITKIAQSALTELAVTLALTCICIPFAASAMIPQMISVSIFCVAVNIIAKITAKWVFKHTISRFVSHSFQSASFYCGSGANAAALIHETGHAIAARLLFDSHPQIRILPEGGWTRYSTKAITSLGQKIGFRRCIFFITLAGPTLILLVASITMIVGFILRDCCPCISPYLIGVAFWVFFDHATYAFSATDSALKNVSHDFFRLKAFGINPIVAAISIIAIPILITTTFLLKDCIKRNYTQRT